MTIEKLSKHILCFKGVVKTTLALNDTTRFTLHDKPFVIIYKASDDSTHIAIRLSKQKLYEFNSRYAKFVAPLEKSYDNTCFVATKIDSGISDDTLLNFIGESYGYIFNDLAELTKAIYLENDTPKYFSGNHNKIIEQVDNSLNATLKSKDINK